MHTAASVSDMFYPPTPGVFRGKVGTLTVLFYTVSFDLTLNVIVMNSGFIALKMFGNIDLGCKMCGLANLSKGIAINSCLNVTCIVHCLTH